ncbi:hypothetical protein C8R43DRAFT_1234065 [Mycena crocata]|nr:hypothetical protein C8R43DRAFT_1234065 [Mycena crocata]
MSDSNTIPASTPVTILLANPTTVIGPIFLGNVFNWMLTGLLITQVYTYWRNFPKDRRAIKLLVYIVFAFDLVQTAFGTHETWWYAIEKWGSVAALQAAPWTALMNPILSGIISAMVQIFYAYRIWSLKRNLMPRVLASFIVLLAFAQSLSAIIASSLLERELSQENLIRLHPLFSFSLAGSFSTDILITGSMIWILYTAKSSTRVSNTDSLLNRLILNVIQTGTVTVVCAGVALALFINFTDKNYYFAFIYILGKLYSNSFMATLNLRAPRRHSEQSETIGMRIQVSRQIERELDGVKMSAAAKHSTPSSLKWKMTTDSNVEDSLPGGKPSDYDLTHGNGASTVGVGDPADV